MRADVRKPEWGLDNLSGKPPPVFLRIPNHGGMRARLQDFVVWLGCSAAALGGRWIGTCGGYTDLQAVLRMVM